MMSPSELEEAFAEFTQNLQKHIPDGVIAVDLKVLHQIGLLQHDQLDSATTHDHLMHYFHVLETPEKVTLFNEQFVVWIMPKVATDISTTMTFIALLNHSKPHLELVFSTAGVYNTPKFILKILEHFLTEVTDTEAMISSINRPKNT